jgi:hypothetical protein
VNSYPKRYEFFILEICHQLSKENKETKMAAKLGDGALPPAKESGRQSMPYLIIRTEKRRWHG